MDSKTPKMAYFLVGSTVFSDICRRDVLIVAGPNRKGVYRVRFGDLEMEVPASSLRELPTAKARRKKSLVRGSVDKQEGTLPALDLHGLSVQEALLKVEQYIDRGILQHCTRLEIVHGIGSGALRKALHQYAETSRYITNVEVDSNNPGVSWLYL